MLEAVPFVSEVVVLDTTTSTNDEARRRASEGAPSGTVVIAGAQSGGRGSRGRSWFAPPGLGVYLSVVLRPALRPEASTRWTIGAAVAVAEACESLCGAGFVVEWPNDVVLRGGKVAGVLAEGRSGAGGVLDLVLGIGINVGHRREDFPEEIRERAASLRSACGARDVPDRETVAAEVLSRLGSVGSALDQDRWREVADRWLRLAPASRGARVRVRPAPGGAAGFAGTTRGIDRTGALLVERIDGTMVAVRDGDSIEAMEGDSCS